MIYSHNLNFLV